MYLRFTTGVLEPDSGRKQGILVAAHALRDSEEITGEEHRQLRLLLAWFNSNLNIPSCLKDPQNRRALSWFKPEAKRPLQKMWELTYLLQTHDIEVQVHKTPDPGIVLFEDGWQIVAKPHRGARVTW